MKVALLLSFVALLSVACGNDTNEAAAQTQTLDVTAFDFHFENETLLIEPGASVTINFTNNGENLHSFTVDDFNLEIEANSGESVSSTFTAPTTPGAYDFYCKYHPDDMQGTISIGGASDPINNPDDNPTNEDDADVEVDVDTE
ncbi:MAG: hypothetical protein QOG54_2579 [Actinomycetota bacterium]|jgi:plastocyanin|nr:hypothetical protein [Actinomycetota bacterium]